MRKTFFMLSILIYIATFTCKQSKAQCHPDDWLALKALYESTDGDNWTNKSGWEDIIAKHADPPNGCDLNMLFGVEVDNIKGRVVVLDLSGRLENTFDICNLDPANFSVRSITNTIPDGYTKPLEYKFPGNNLTGTIPAAIELLIELQTLILVNDRLRGSIPDVFESLESLTSCLLFGNKLSGAIPTISTNLECFSIQENYFTCDEITAVDQSIFNTFYFNPQIINHTIEPFIVDAGDELSIDLSNSIATLTCIKTDTASDPRGFENPTLPGSSDQGMTYFWKKNNIEISGANQIQLELPITQPIDAGVYTLSVYDDPSGIEFISDPIYVIYSGYDFYGQPVEYDQIMVEFKNSSFTEIYEEDILYANAGSVIDSCNCNREIYLWQFPADSLAANALVEIDKKTQTTNNSDGEVDGGFVNLITFNQTSDFSPGFEVVGNATDNNIDDVIVYILDTGLDSNNFGNSSFLYPSASLDNCYTIPNGSGYSYVDDVTISNDYNDEVWHGTFGFDVITKGFPLGNNIKLIPLKIFDSTGQGNLFDLTCALYHAIDHGANIVNISAGYKGQKSTILERAINKARENNIFICAAAGNDEENIDANPQYPASFAGRYHYVYDSITKELIDSVRYANVISVGCLDAQNNISAFSNIAEGSVTLYANGEDISGTGLNNELLSASGTSMATFLVTRELALEIAADNTRNYEVIFQDFQTNRLVPFPNITSITNARLNITLGSPSNRLSNTISDSKRKHSTEENVVYVDEQKILVDYKANEAGWLHVQLYDMNGRILNEQQKFSISKGSQLLTILINNSSATNVYLFKTEFVTATVKEPSKRIKYLIHRY